jgi:hypothetical protein
MKKLSVIIAVMALLAFAGCASGGGKAVDPADLPPYAVDISTLPVVKNEKPFTKNYDDFMVRLPDFPVDVTKYQRMTIRAKVFNAAGEQIPFEYSQNCMVSVIINPDVPDAQIRTEGPNVPLKEFNVAPDFVPSRQASDVSSDRGVRVRLTAPPKALLFQNAGDQVKFIEVTEIVFHNQTASGN